MRYYAAFGPSPSTHPFAVEYYTHRIAFAPQDTLRGCGFRVAKNCLEGVGQWLFMLPQWQFSAVPISADRCQHYGPHSILGLFSKLWALVVMNYMMARNIWRYQNGTYPLATSPYGRKLLLLTTIHGVIHDWFRVWGFDFIAIGNGFGLGFW